jgi:hypothetical protein
MSETYDNAYLVSVLPSDSNSNSGQDKYSSFPGAVEPSQKREAPTVVTRDGRISPKAFVTENCA